MISIGRRRIPDWAAGWLFVGPAILYLLIMYFFPLSNALYLSLTADGKWNGIANYIAVLSDSLFWRAFGNTVIFTFFSVVAHLFIGLVTALILNTDINPKLMNIFRGLLMVPWLIATVVAAGIWILIYHPIGIFNHFLMQTGIIQSPIAWLGNPNTALFAVMMVNIWKFYPLFMVFILSGLKSIPKEQYEAAHIDGARAHQRFLYITLPGIKSVIIFITLLDAVWAFRHFDFPYLMTGGGPINSTELLTTYTYFITFQGFRFNQGATIANIMLVFALLFSILYLRLYRERE